MEKQSEQLRTLVEEQSRRIQELEQSLQAMTGNFGMLTCESYGGHRHAKQKRDHYFRKFMENMLALWSLQRQRQSVDDDDDEDKDDKDEIPSGEKILLKAADDYLKKAQDEEFRLKQNYQKYDSKSEDCIIYREIWLPKKTPQDKKLEFQGIKISMGGGETKSFNEAISNYMDENFEDNGVFRVPPYWVYRDKIKVTEGKDKKGKDQKGKGKKGKEKNDLTLLSDYEISNLQEELGEKEIEKILEERKAGRAVEKVVDMLQKWAEQESGNMFIFTDYKYTDYLKKINSPSAVTNVDGDHDIMALSESHGVFFIQVKSCEEGEKDMNVQKKTREAFSQSMKDTFVFLQSNRDLPYVFADLPVYGLVALPNLQDREIEQHKLCLHHRSLVLTNSSLKSVDVFAAWIKDAVQILRPTKLPLTAAFSHKDFRELCGRYVGLASAVTVPTSLTGIHKASRKLRLINLLTPVQKRVRDSDKAFVIISGDSGTGKSLILAAKARQILQKAISDNSKCHVNIVTCTDINDSLFCALKMSYRSSQQLEVFVNNENGINITQFRELHQDKAGRDEDDAPRFKFKVTPEIFAQTILDLTKDEAGIKRHLFMDEVPFELLKQSREAIDKAIEDVPRGTNVWLSVSTHTYRVKSSRNEDPRWIVESMPSEFHFEYLDLIKRVPMSLFKVIKEIQEITGDGHGEFSKCGHVIGGPKPLLYRLDKCECPPSEGMDYMACSCVEERTYNTIEKVFNNLKGIENEDITIMLHNFAFSGTTFKNLKHLLNTTFEKMKIKLRWSSVLHSSPEEEEEKDEKPVMIVDARTFVGCEGKVVISVDQCGMFNHFAGKRGVGWHKISMVRCVAQYIFVTWPEEEAAQNWRKHIGEYEMDVLGRGNLSEEQIAFRKDQIEQSIAASYEPSCLEKLLAKDLFVKM